MHLDFPLNTNGSSLHSLPIISLHFQINIFKVSHSILTVYSISGARKNVSHRGSWLQHRSITSCTDCYTSISDSTLLADSFYRYATKSAQHIAIAVAKCGVQVRSGEAISLVHQQLCCPRGYRDSKDCLLVPIFHMSFGSYIQQDRFLYVW